MQSKNNKSVPTFAILGWVLLGLVELGLAIAVLTSKDSIVRSLGIYTFNALKTGTIVVAAILMAYSMFWVVVVAKKAASRSKGVREAKQQRQQDMQDPIKNLQFQIMDYLNTDESTPSFRAKLQTIHKQSTTLVKKRDSIKKLVEDRLGEGGLSHEKFVGQTNQLLEFLCATGTDLVEKLKHFDETEYSVQLARYERENRYKEYAQAKTVMSSYEKYLNDVATIFDTAVIQLDSLILEFAKLNDEELEKSLAALEELNKTISHTQLYK
jgi:hypothetical protein